MAPDQHTIAEHHFSVGDGHTLYVQDWGNREAKLPILVLHGGLGSGTRDSTKYRFDPQTQRVIFHDQRGCGNSRPYGSLEHNTTDDLIEDIKHIADKLKVSSFVLNGGSWGSTLALAFALKYPKYVAGMVLHGIFTGSQAEIDWLDQGQFSMIYPEAWDRYIEATPGEHHKNPSRYHFEQALSASDPEQAKRSAYAYECLESNVCRLDDRFIPGPYDTYDPTSIRTEIHYLMQRCFMPDRHILDNGHTLTMPIYLVQGRYDIVCPPTTAYELSKAAPNCTLTWTINGHMAEHEAHNLINVFLKQLTA
jgi:proline iminopeptidase